MRFGTNSFRKQFPIFKHHPNLVYLDSAATTQKPKMVIEGITQFYEKENANIHRGIYDLAAQATQKGWECQRIYTACSDFSSEDFLLGLRSFGANCVLGLGN